MRGEIEMRRRLLLTGIMTLGTATFIFGQWILARPITPSASYPAQGRADRIGRRLDHLDRHLQLTGDQRARIQSILQEESNQIQALHEDRTLSPADKRTRRADIRRGTQTQIRQLLSSEQQARFDRMEERARERRAHRTGRVGRRAA